MGAAILMFLQAKRRVLPFYEINEHFLEDRMTSSVAKHHKPTHLLDVLWEICFISTNKAEPISIRSRRYLSNDQVWVLLKISKISEKQTKPTYLVNKIAVKLTKVLAHFTKYAFYVANSSLNDCLL